MSESRPADIEELRRLEVLHHLQVLDTEPESAFDDLAALAAQLCGASMASVTLVDRDRQWFKARVGVSATETGRDVSFCARAIEHREPLVVPDAQLDPRFAANRLVTGPPFIRFYAGVPLHVDGYAVGTLCVLDTEPRTLSALQLEQMSTLARQVVSQLRLRRDRDDLVQESLARARAEVELRAQQVITDGLLAHTEAHSQALAESEQRWRLLVENSPVPVAVIGLDGRYAYANPKALQLYGAENFADLRAQPAIDFVGEHDREPTRALFARVLAGETVTNHAWELRLRDGTTVAVEVNATAIQYAGTPAVQVELRDVRVQRSVENTIRQSEQRFRTLFGQSPVGMTECSPDGMIVDVNDEICRMLGYSRDELVGMSPAALVAESSQVDLQRADIAALDESGSYFTQRNYRRKDGTVLHTQVGVAVVRDESGVMTGLLATATDISDQVTTKRELLAAQEEMRLRQIFTDAVLDSIDVGIVACDENENLTVFNRTSQRWHGMGLDPSDLTTASDELAAQFDLYDDDGSVLGQERIPLLRALHDGVVSDAEIVISPHAIPAVRVQCSGRSMTDSDGKLLGAVVAMTDITSSRAQQQALRASETRFRAIFDNDPAGLVVLGPDAQILQVNRTFTELVGQPEAMNGEAIDVPALFGTDRYEFDRMLDLARRDPGRPVTSEQQLVAAVGEPVWCVVTVIDLPDPQTGRCILLQAEDITMRKQAEQRLTRQAMYDSLTSLPNRVMLLDRIESAITRLRTRESHKLYALFCDLDGFKAVNDTHGHDAGDALLTEIAERLRAAVRPVDTVARLGGDEFVVLCEDLPGPEDAEVIARRIEEAIAGPVLWRGQRLTVTTSIGIASGSVRTSPEDLLRHADTAMYEAKRLGKDRHHVFDENVHRRSAGRRRVDSGLRSVPAPARGA